MFFRFLPAVDVPKPTSNPLLEKLGAAVVGAFFTLVIWASLIGIGLALLNLVTKRGSASRMENVIWLATCVIVFAILQGIDWLLPSVGGIMLSPLDVLKGN